MQSILVDFHSHILPGVDHGASNIEESLSLLKMAHQAGLQTVVATPHFYPHEHDVEEFLACREHSYQLLNEVKEKVALPKLVKGAEVLLCPGMENMDGLEMLCIQGTKVLLLELPFHITKESIGLLDTVETLLHEKKLTVVLAHPNRYETEVIDQAIAMGCSLQFNVEDVLRLRERSRVKRWLGAGVVSAVGSDVHHEKAVYKSFAKATAVLGAASEEINYRSQMLLPPVAR